MPITASAKKAMRQSARRASQNKTKKVHLKEAIKKYRKLVAAKKTEEAQKMLPEIYKIADKTAKSGVIKKNTASRVKSRLAKLLK
ncbi:MAG: 30S ribosomal protein S20 [Candidatus Liptonbacteria bacterium]